MKKLLKHLWTKIAICIVRSVEAQKLKKHIKLAKHYHKQTGKQYLVIKEQRGYKVIDNTWMKDCNNASRKYGSKTYSYQEFLEMSVYKTPKGTYSER